MTYLRLLGVWLLLALLMPLNGALREFGFKRVMSAPVAEWLSLLTGIAVILATTRWLFRVPADAPDGQLLLQALTLVTLTVAYEFGIGFAGGRTLAEMLQHYAIWRGQLWRGRWPHAASVREDAWATAGPSRPATPAAGRRSAPPRLRCVRRGRSSGDRSPAG